MPQFGSPFSELANGRKLTDEELVRAIRFMVAAEYEATQMYVQLAESTSNKLAVAVLKDIADEELVHAGEFLKLLYALAPDEEALYAKGAREVEEMEKITTPAGILEPVQKLRRSAQEHVGESDVDHRFR
ncbi:MAG: ferritin family protein [Formivibrio sp.]|nr:ferritin family protein [Formivibrio sp.]